MSNRRIDSEFQRRIVIGLKGRILEAQQALLGMAQKFLAGRTGADVVCLPPGRELGAPLPEALCAREWGEVVRPDGYGIWTEADISIPFLLEYDNGTERLERLAGKLDGYARLAAAAGHPNWVLFTFPTPRREHDARRALAERGVPVATASRSPGAASDAAIWSSVRSDGPRIRLAQLANLPLDRA